MSALGPMGEAVARTPGGHEHARNWNGTADRSLLARSRFHVCAAASTSRPTTSVRWRRTSGPASTPSLQPAAASDASRVRVQDRCRLAGPSAHRVAAARWRHVLAGPHAFHCNGVSCRLDKASGGLGSTRAPSSRGRVNTTRPAVVAGASTTASIAPRSPGRWRSPATTPGPMFSSASSRSAARTRASSPAARDAPT